MASISKKNKAVKFEKNVDLSSGENDGVFENENVNFRELLQMHENTIMKFIESSFRNVHHRIDDVVKDVQDLKSAHNFQDKDFSDKIKMCNENIKEIEKSVKSMAVSQLQGNDSSIIQEIKAKLNDLENRSRRNNLRFDGIKDDVNESWDQTEDKLKAFIKNKLKVSDNIIIERSHRIGHFDDDKNRCIVAKFNNWKQHGQVLKAARNVKPPSMFVYEDYSDETMRKRIELIPLMKKKREEGKFAFIKVDKLIVRERKD